MKFLLFLLAGLPSLQEGSREGLVLERAVKLTFQDSLNRTREVHRREIVRIRGTDVSITDLTFGGRLVIRADRKRVWAADPLRGEFSELGFDDIAAIRMKALDEIRAAKARIPGTPEEKELETILSGLDLSTAEPKVRIESEGGKKRVAADERTIAEVEVNPDLRGDGFFDALTLIGAFPSGVCAKLKELGGFPVRGTLRYVLFLDRVQEQFEVTAARKESVPDSEFELPPGLKRVPLARFEPAPERRPAKPANFERSFKEDEIDRQNNPLNEEPKKDKP